MSLSAEVASGSQVRCAGRIGQQIGHHARPRRASATAPLRTGADMCKTGSGAGSGAEATTEQDRRRSNTSGRRTEQEGEWVPTLTRTRAGGCTPQMTHQAGTPRQVPNTATLCAQGGDGPERQQGRGGTGQDRPWQQQRGRDWKEMPPAAPSVHGHRQIQNMPERGHPGEG